jgi:hypothetical protein
VLHIVLTPCTMLAHNSVAEMAVGAFPVLCADEIGTGLDGEFKMPPCLSFNTFGSQAPLHSCNYVRYLHTAR